MLPSNLLPPLCVQPNTHTVVYVKVLEIESKINLLYFLLIFNNVAYPKTNSNESEHTPFNKIIEYKKTGFDQVHSFKTTVLNYGSNL
jgi:hypothetical protein